MNLTEFLLPQQDCEIITDFVLQEKTKWEKDLNNVKSLTSGFNPNYEFLHNIGNWCCKNLLPSVSNYNHWEKSCWWVNFYEKGHYTTPHVHLPEHYSAIIIVKPALESYCLKFETESTNYMVEEKQGLGLLFESYLKHSVEPVKDERITIAMDFVKK